MSRKEARAFRPNCMHSHGKMRRNANESVRLGHLRQQPIWPKLSAVASALLLAYIWVPRGGADKCNAAH